MGIDEGCPIHGDIGVDFCAQHDVCELCIGQGREKDCCVDAEDRAMESWEAWYTQQEEP